LIKYSIYLMYMDNSKRVEPVFTKYNYYKYYLQHKEAYRLYYLKKKRQKEEEERIGDYYYNYWKKELWRRGHPSNPKIGF
jgi:hypothetical protein